MKIIEFWCLIAQIKRQNALNAKQKTSTLSHVPLLKKLRKTPKNDFFFKWSLLGVFLDFFSNGTLHRVKVFLRCNQCVLVLHLSYQIPPTNNFHFSAYNSFFSSSNFQTPRTGGVLKKNVFFLHFPH